MSLVRSLVFHGRSLQVIALPVGTNCLSLEFVSSIALGMRSNVILMKTLHCGDTSQAG